MGEFNGINMELIIDLYDAISRTLEKKKNISDKAAYYFNFVIDGCDEKSGATIREIAEHFTLQQILEIIVEMDEDDLYYDKLLQISKNPTEETIRTVYC